MKTGAEPILVVDGDVEFRAFACRLFRQAGFAAEEAGTGREALEAARATRPLLVVLDVCLEGVSGFEVAHELRDEFGERLAIVFVSGERTDPLDRAAGLLIGGDDYLVKPVHPDELLARARRLISRSRDQLGAARSGTSSELTSRELEILRLLAQGMRPKEIARELVISPKTVASHTQHVLAKLGAHSRAEAVALAYIGGFVTVPEGTLPTDTGAQTVT